MNKKLTLRNLGAQNCINLLKPPRCYCGCGGYAELIINDKEDDNVFTVAGSLLEETDCDNAWIFIMEGWAISGAHTSEDGIRYFTTAIPENEKPMTDFNERIEFVKEIIVDVKPHCVGVLQQMESGGFRVVDKRIYD